MAAKDAFGRLKTIIGNGSSDVYAALAAANVDNESATSLGLLITSRTLLYNGTVWTRHREINTLKTVNAAALATNTPQALWTPAAGKKFRLRGIEISSEDLLAGELVEVLDGATVILNFRPTTTGFQTQLELDANGYISTTADNVLNIRHQGAAGRDIAANAWGNEE
ncbi:MAG: hypothetical protein WBC70_17325 [Candidatus Aminicenantales bacterium]